jgi:hypothetical protein
MTTHRDSVGGDSGRGDGGGSSANQLSGRHACGVEGVDGALDQCHEQRRTEVPTKNLREVVRVLAVLQVSLEEEAGAELLSEPLLKQEDARAKLTVGGGDQGQDEGRDWPHAVKALPFGDGRKEGITVELEPVLLKQPVGHHTRTNLASITSVARELELIFSEIIYRVINRQLDDRVPKAQSIVTGV